jgi:hypothetical protein
MKNIWLGSWRLAAPEKLRVFLMLVLVWICNTSPSLLTTVPNISTFPA